MNKSNYLNRITSEVVNLAITITHSGISRGHSPFGILSKVYLKFENSANTPALSDSRLGIHRKSKEYNLFYTCAKLCSFGRICPNISLTAPTNWCKSLHRGIECLMFLGE